jgi:iron-sulfur cluster assembly accessory protein
VTFTLTEKAAERLRRIRWRKKAEGHVRIVAEKRGGAQWVFQMGFDTQREGDEKTESQGVSVVMDKQTAKALDGMTVDFEGTGGKGTFTFTRSSTL